MSKFENEFKICLDDIIASEDLKNSTLLYLKKYNSKKNRFPLKLSYAFVITFIFLSSYYLYFIPNTYVDIDVNPSIELTLNKFNRVIKAEGINVDGSIIIKNMKVKNKSYDEAVDLIISKLNSEGYFQKENLVSITVQTDNKNTERKLVSEIKSHVEKSSHHHNIDTDLEIFSVDKDFQTMAQNLKVTPAKLKAIMELQKVEPASSVEECSHHSIEEIREKTNNADMKTEHFQEHGKNNHHY